MLSVKNYRKKDYTHKDGYKRQRIGSLIHRATTPEQKIKSKNYIRMKLSKNFTLAELTKSQTAIRMGLNNNPSEKQIENLKILCERLLQPVRDHFGKVVTVSSGFRDLILNRTIGSGDGSQHIMGMAADIEIFDVPNNELSDWIKETLCTTNLYLNTLI